MPQAPLRPLIDRIRKLAFGVAAHAGCRPPVSCIAEMAGTMFVDPHSLDLPKLNPPDGTGPAQPKHARPSQGFPPIIAQGIHAAMVEAPNEYQSWAPSGRRNSDPQLAASCRNSLSHISALWIADRPICLLVARRQTMTREHISSSAFDRSRSQVLVRAAGDEQSRRLECLRRPTTRIVRRMSCALHV